MYMKQMKERRLKLLPVSPQDMVSMFTSGNDFKLTYLKSTKYKIPEDCQAMGSSYDPIRQSYVIALHSEEFPIVEQGEMLPLIHDHTNIMFECATLADDIKQLGTAGRELLREELAKYD